MNRKKYQFVKFLKIMFFHNKVLGQISKFLKNLKIDTFLYQFYSEFYADSESVTKN